MLTYGLMYRYIGHAGHIGHSYANKGRVDLKYFSFIFILIKCYCNKIY